jgi:hypothetical protein
MIGRNWNVPAGKAAGLQPITSSGVDDVSLEIAGGHDDIGFMTRRFLTCTAVVAMLAVAPALAQIPPTGGTPLLPPPQSSAPPPSMAVPVVPKLDAMPRSPGAPSLNSSFGDRVTGCLQGGAAAGLNSSDNAVYSRSCANH